MSLEDVLLHAKCRLADGVGSRVLLLHDDWSPRQRCGRVAQSQDFKDPGRPGGIRCVAPRAPHGNAALLRDSPSHAGNARHASAPTLVGNYRRNRLVSRVANVDRWFWKSFAPWFWKLRKSVRALSCCRWVSLRRCWAAALSKSLWQGGLITLIHFVHMA